MRAKVVADTHRRRRADPGEAVADQRSVPQLIKVSLSIDSSGGRVAAADEAGVLPPLTMCLGTRTEARRIGRQDAARGQIVAQLATRRQVLFDGAV